VFKTISIVAILGTVAAVAVHYFCFGPKEREARKEGGDVRRFSLWERLVGAITLAGFLGLAISGFVSIIVLGGPLRGWWGVVHMVAAPAFGVGLAAAMLTWAEDCCFGARGGQCAESQSGGLGGGEGFPAGRFNARQKALFWGIASLAVVAIVSGLGRMWPLFDSMGQEVLYQAHRYSALLLVLAVIVLYTWARWPARERSSR